MSRISVSTEARTPAGTLAFTAWVPLVMLPVCALALNGRSPPWVFMWAMALSIFAGCKWLTWCEAGKKTARSGSTTGVGRGLAYLLLWPGMDAATFLKKKRPLQSPGSAAWTAAGLKTLFGAALLWGVVPRLPEKPALLVAWTGLVGLGFLLHFGIFHLLALLWQRLGIDVRPIMHAPCRAASVGEFWSARWNRGFHQLAGRFVYRPLAPRLGRAGATIAAFLASGLVHELVISLPAGGGYGGPTAYFLIQALGVLLEESPFGKHLKLGRGARGWAMVLLLTAGPAYWLFHPQFQTQVTLPFLQAIHSH